MKKRIFVLPAKLAVTMALVCATAPAWAQTDCALSDPVCPEWAARYDGPDHLYDHGFFMVMSPDGTRMYVTGASTSTSGGQDFATVAYASGTGQQLWAARYDGPSHGDDAPYGGDQGNAIGISTDGSMVFVTGRSTDANGKNQYVTIAYHAADGTEAWTSHYVTPEESQATALALSGDGQRLYVTGYSALAIAAPPAPGVANYDFGTVAYDTLTGQQLWVARYDGPAAFWDVPYSIGVASVRQPDGSRREQIFVTGRSNGASSANQHADFATVAYDGNTGAQLWVARYDGPANDRDLAYALGVSPDGSSLFVTGESVGNGTSSDYATVCYDAVTGAQRWAARYDDSDLDLALGLAVSPAGDRVAVTGFSVNPGALTVIDRSAATVVYDAATGAQVWAARHGEIDGAAAKRLAFSRDGRRLYVAGFENGNVIFVNGVQVGHAPALTLAYDAATGTEVWATHYSGPTGDEGNSGLAISPDDAHVLVTGGGQGQGADFATLSYATGAPTPPPVQLVSALSRKVHGSVGQFDIDLPLTGNPGIECRSGGANGDYTIIFTFTNLLTSVGGASIASGTGTVSSSAIDSDDARQYIVSLTGVANAQVIAVSLAYVYDSAGNGSNAVSTSMGVLLGDTNADRSVNSADISQTKSQSGNSVSAFNFREDVATDGNLNSADIGLVKSKSGTALPSGQ